MSKNLKKHKSKEERKEQAFIEYPLYTMHYTYSAWIATPSLQYKKTGYNGRVMFPKSYGL